MTTTDTDATAHSLPNVREQRPLGYWLRHIDGAIDASFRALLAEQGLNRRSWQVLNTIACGPLTVAEVDETMAAFIGPAEPTMRPHVDAFAARGWVLTDEGGQITLTETGTAAHRRADAATGRQRAEMMSCLSAEEFTQLMTLLQRLAGHLDELAAKD
ncbi:MULTISPECIES: MarR family winged helix-turn-helix transcriptional regulator [Kitasatospora]|uniref:MarR family winged helix-turn-helix transcriptional regulator n=1 Tax=Kitasatospora TaxID=2063 RepID=UPI000C7047E3|nr:hypothetical protein [Kitasatospora sp. GP30]MDH6139232.1 DNA-binding MarR family transcriptional regulator [Kitasatospora sp. GP30]